MEDSKGTVQSNHTRLSNNHLNISLPEDEATKDCSLSNNIDIDMSLSQKLNEPFKPLLNASPDPSHPMQNNTNANHAPRDNKLQSEAADMGGGSCDSLAQLTMSNQVKHAGAIHPNFDTEQSALDPDRSLYEVPIPPPRYKHALKKLLQGNTENTKPSIEIDTLLDGSYHSQPLDGYPAVIHHYEQASMWALIATPELASHLELLQLGGLINLPDKFFAPIKLAPSSFNTKYFSSSFSKGLRHSNGAPVNKNSLFNSPLKNNEHLHTDAKNNPLNTGLVKQGYELLLPLTEMNLLDLSDIYQACSDYPSLTRYGFSRSVTNTTKMSVLSAKAGIEVPSRTDKNNNNNLTVPAQSAKLLPDIPEMINDIFAPNWELILYPERFDNGIDSLPTDILACSVAVHILKQCQPRKSINRSITVHQICQHMRSYVLSQCNLTPQFELQYRHIRLFEGHVIVAACHLGLKVIQASQHTTASITDDSGLPNQNLDDPIYINISSRASLMTRYPDISSYYINGWS